MYIQKINRIAVLGAGAFGTALAVLYSKKFDVSLYSCFQDHVAKMKKKRQNDFLENVDIPASIDIDVINSFQKSKFDCVFWAFPLKPSLEILRQIAAHLDGNNVIICAKGLLHDGTFLTDAFSKILPNSRLGYLSGPNFAHELAAFNNSAAIISATDILHASDFANALSLETFKLFPSTDVKGAQLCGAGKNIIAIASGIVAGLHLGYNAQAALVTEGLLEISALGVALGCKSETFQGLCGFGDLFLTASSGLSRNRSFGEKLAKKELSKSNQKPEQTCEGYESVVQILHLSKKHSINVPICQAVYRILFENAAPESIIDVFK